MQGKEHAGRAADTAGGPVDVWWVLLDDLPAELLQRNLLPAERATAVAGPAAGRSAASRAGLREVLGGYLEIAPAEVRLDRLPRGKPVLGPDHRHAGLEFSVSHAGPLGVVAVTRAAPVGVDIERVGARAGWRLVAAGLLTDRESREILECPPGEQERRFYAVWTAKEAVAKASGRGLPWALREIEVTGGGEGPRVVRQAGAETARWALLPLPGPPPALPGFVGTLAVEGAPPTVRVRGSLPRS